jgi:hypothetical protein
MDWQDFFKLTVSKSGKKGNEIFFQAHLKTPSEFPMQELILSHFDYLNLSAVEKKKFSIGLRKIVLCHDLFETETFKAHCREFKSKIKQSKEKEFVFHTHGGGIYLFLQLIKDHRIHGKKIICYTSELPLPIMSLRKNPNVQIIYSPHRSGFLSDFSTLWKESELMSLFELKDFKASA